MDILVIITLVVFAAVIALFLSGVRRFRMVCEQLSREVGGDVAGYFNPRFVTKEKEWTITLDLFQIAYHGTFTCITVPIVNKDSFRFSIYRKTLVSRVLGRKLEGVQDIEVACPELDDNFIVRSNSVPKVRALLASAVIRRLIRTQLIQLNSYFASTSGLLYFEEIGIITDVQRLKSLFELFGETLNQLCHIGSTSKEPPIIPPEEPTIGTF